MNTAFMGYSTIQRFAPLAPVARTLIPGDQVRVWRGWYWHHAIYVDGNQFVEFGSDVWGGVVAYVTERDLRGGAALEFVRAGGDAAVTRALSQLNQAGFSLLTDNCEHFATWCTTGRWESEQVQNALLAGGIAVLVLFAGALARA